MVARALELGASEVNIKSGSKATGIWSIDPNIFQDIDFLPSSTTDRPCPDINDNLNAERKEVVEVEGNVEAIMTDNGNEEAIHEDSINCSKKSISLLSLSFSSTFENDILESVSPFPKAPPRKTTGTRQGRDRPNHHFNS